MSWFRRLFGASKPEPSTLRMNAIREAISADGDQTSELEPLLKQPVDLNTLQGEPVFPILLLGEGIMMTNPGTYPLILAAMLHKQDRTRLLVKHGARLDVTCAYGRTPLHWAVLGEPDSSLLNNHEVLCKEAASNNTPQPLVGEIGSDEQTASLATTRLLLEHGADPNAPDGLGQTPLHRACSVGGKVEHLRLLLQRGADVNAATPTGSTPLMMATNLGLHDTVAALLEFSADPNRADIRGSTPLHWACARGFGPIARQLLSAHADPKTKDNEGYTPLALATAIHDKDLLQALRDAGATEMPSSGSDQTEPSAGAPPDLDPPNALLFATARGDLRAVQALLLRGQVALEATTEDGWTALHEAVVHGPEMTRLLLEAGANANASSEGGYTPLHRAAAKGQTEVVKLLVEHGADVSAEDVSGNTLVKFAETSGHPPTIAAVAELCRNTVPHKVTAEDMDRSIAYLEKSIAKAPERIRRAREAGHKLSSGGDGSSPEHAMVVHAADVGWGITFVYQYLDEKFGPRWTKHAEAAGIPFKSGWNLVKAISMVSRDRHLNCMEFALPDGRQDKMYFDVTEWNSLDASLLLLSLHAFMNRPPRTTDARAGSGG
jgi:ankyrin repeat protein